MREMDESRTRTVEMDVRDRAPDAGVATLPGTRLHEIFEARARSVPDRIAISVLDETITYRQLDARANQLAHRLRALGVGPDVLVGLCIDRSIEMIVGLLAIVKAGGAYVPIDPSYPGKRIRLLIDDSAIAVMVTVSRVSESLAGCAATILCIDNDPSLATQPVVAPPPVGTDRNLAYIIYTSGSTGTPKGVLIEHRNVVRLFEQTQHWFGFGERDVWTMFHSIGFDFSVWEIWGALLYGGRLVIVPYDVSRSPGRFHELLQREKVTVLNQTPSAFRQLVEVDAAGAQPADLALRLVIFGGERLDVTQLGPWSARRGDDRPVLVNMYGITETTVHVTYRRILRSDLESPGLSPIGVPIPDLQLHLLDDVGNPVPDGTPGEMYVAGPGLARGYLNRPELTAEHFVQARLAGGSVRAYHSGDRALRTPGGELVYLGRSDDQIKVRGFRIEPREIEVCLSGDARVAACVVSPHDYGDGDVRLVAYVVARSGLGTTPEGIERLTSELGERAAAELPAHMRPSAYMFLSELPMTEHGKIDRKALPPPIGAERLHRDEAAGARSETEQAIKRIWEQILDIPGVGVDDDFFDLGGTSLALIRIFGIVNDQFQVNVDVSALIEGATISRLASCVDAELKNGHSMETR
jgi:amino acid adenylation domain-containing protein